MHHLIVQLQSRYPSSSLMSELLTVHDGNYVVRALVQLGGTTLASGMAAASNIEAAEDRAKVRALEALGIGSASASLLNPPLPGVADKFSSVDSSDLTVSATRLSQVGSGAIATSPPPVATAATSSSIPKTAAFPNIAVSLEPDTEFDTEFNIDNTEFYLSSPDEEEFSNGYSLSDPGVPEEPPQTSSATSTSSSKSSRPRKNGKASAEPKSVEPLIPLPDQPIDNSDVIAQTDVELRRLGWGREQGRKHLEQVYGKRSRQQLTDAELLDFLHYLESQP
jgi:hypothetical protein